MSDSDVEAEASFSVLPARLKRRIDRAFDNALVDPTLKKPESAPGPAGGLVVENPEPAAGGFVTEDTSAGGFLPSNSSGFSEPGTRTPGSSEDEDTPSHPAHTHIPLTLIPTALQLLDLQPDDEDVLDVFRNAASGWEGARGSAPRSQTELRVSRKDWRAVCAALLDATVGGGDNENDDDEAMSEREDVVEESEGDSEEYVESNSDESIEDASDEDYQAGGFTRPKRKIATTTRNSRKKQRRATSSDEESDSDFDVGRTRRITPRQRQECRRAFALFFPEVPEENLDSQKIMIKDISRVASLLKEKITAEEILEMLEAFTTSPDKSMSLSNFERMMVTAKLA
ncbi:hypothetical protein EIP86_005455 [Pleurotus ostreatoroseus]|nr:hypothetical protein EIP86_005455 [Pleurotus ostreatoroseus]